jgi:plasmid stabilization system protein ParE
VTFRVRFTPDAVADLDRLYDFLLEDAHVSAEIAERALVGLRNGIALLEASPFSCRKATARNPFLRELIVPFGSAGYVVLFEIEDERTVTILALRHQREEDFY